MTPANLFTRRSALGLSQEALAHRLGVTSSTVWGWENGRRGIPPYLHMALDWLAATGQGNEDMPYTLKRQAPGLGKGEGR